MNVPIKCNLKHAEWGGADRNVPASKRLQGIWHRNPASERCACVRRKYPQRYAGGHGSMDKHRWDTVVVKVIRDDEIISV